MSEAFSFNFSDRGVLRKDKYFESTEYYPHLGQARLHYDTHRHRVAVWGRRAGKTLCGGKEVEPTAFVLNRLGQPQRGWIVGPEYPDAEKEFRIIYNTFKKLGIDQISNKFVNNPESGSMRIATEWGWDLQCRSARHPETLVGEGLDFVLMVEAGRHKLKTWSEYVRPALSDKRGWSLHTGVPEGATPTSLLYSLYQRGQKNAKNWKSWRFPSWINTAVFPGGREDEEIVEAREELTEDEFARQYEAKFVERTGTVMKEWDDDIHLADLDYDRNMPLYAGVDYGYTNPFVWLWIQVDEHGNVYILKEYYITQQDTVEIAKKILEDPIYKHSRDNFICFYPDPAEPDDTNILMRELKKPARFDTGGLIKHRIMLIRRHLKTDRDTGRPKLLVDRSCTRFAWEMREGYRWPERKSEIRGDSENPLDRDNHGPEALGRFMKGYFGIAKQPARKRRPARLVKAARR